MTVYIIICACIFLYAAHTAFEDVTLMRHSGETDYPNPPVLFLAGLFIVSFIPVLNLALIGFTVLYRKGAL